MKIKSLLMLFVAATFFMTSCGDGAETTETTETETTTESADVSDSEEMEPSYAIDPIASTLEFSCEMMGMYTHTGTIKFVEGIVLMNDGQLMGGSFIVDMNSIDFTDENFKADSPKENLIGHVMSKDFFDVAEHPTASLNINQVDNDTMALSTLIVRGNDGSEYVKNIEVSKEGGNLVLTGTMTFDRQKYGVTWAHPMKEMVIANDIKLTARIVAAKM